MKYKDYKRHVKLAEVLDKPLRDGYLDIDKYVKYLRGLEKKYHHNSFLVDISFTDIYSDLVIIEITLHNAVVLDYNLPFRLFKDKDEIKSFLTEFINSELVNDKNGKKVNIGKIYYTQRI